MFRDIVVHPTQELPRPSADAYRGGPEWPHFARQVSARHCWGAIPRPVDRPPHPAERDWPYFDRDRFLNPRFRSAPQPRSAATWLDAADTGLWCGPICEHFGHMIADYGMRLLLSARRDPATPLVFGRPPVADWAPPSFFQPLLDHFGIDPERMLLVGKPTRFARLAVVPQAERPYGGFANRAYLRLLDDLAPLLKSAEREERWVFVSRSRLARGRFAGEACLDRALTAAGAIVFHPEDAPLPQQLLLYRRARRLIFSEGSALEALQLLGHIDADVAILPRRPGRLLGNIAALRPLRARVRSLRVLPVMRGIVCGLYEHGAPQTPRGMTVFDEKRLLAGLARLGIDLTPHWDPRAYATERDADIASWVADRLAAPTHPGERAFVQSRLRALSLFL